MGGTLSKIWTHETSISPRSGQKKSCMFFMQERAKLLFETLRPLSILLSCLGRGQFFTSPKTRAAHKERAQNQKSCLVHCAACACDFCAVSAGAGHVSCAESALKFIETCAILSENRESFPQNALRTTPQSSEKPSHPAQHA